MRIRSAGLAVLAFALFGGAAHAEGGADGPEPPAERVLAAVREKDESRLAAVASDPDVEAWMLAHELLSRGEGAAAEALARAVKGPEADALVAYVSRVRSGGPDPVPDIADALNRAYAEDMSGRHDEADRAASAAAEAAEKVGWLWGAAKGWDTSAIAARGALRFPDMRARLERAIAMWRRLGRANDVAMDLFDMGQSHAETGEGNRALSLYAEAEEMFLRAGGDRIGDALTARIREAQGSALGLLGRFHEAVECLRVAREACHPEDLQGRAHIEMESAKLHIEIGEYERARETLEGALSAAGGPGDAGELAGARALLGLALTRLDRHEDAESCYAAARAGFEADGDARAVTAVRIDQAECLRRRGRVEEAARALENLIADAEETGNPGTLAQALAYLGRARSSLGAHDAALKALGKAVRCSREAGAAYAEEECLRILAEVQLAAGDARTALATASEVIQRTRRQSAGLADEAGALARSRRADAIRTGALAALRLGDPAEILRVLEAGRAGALLESLGRDRRILEDLAPAPLVAEEARLRDAEAAARAANAAAVKANDMDRGRETALLYEVTRRTRADLLARLQTAGVSGAAALGPDPVDAARARTLLTEGEAAVLYALLGDRALAVVLTADGVRAVDLGASAALVDAAARFRPEDDPAPFDAAVADLRARLVEPLGLSTSTRRLLVSPDGPLASLPFPLLAGDREVAFVPSLTTLGLLRGMRTPPGEGVLALGDPSFRGPKGPPLTAMRAGELARLGPLPHAREEAIAVGTVVLLGEDATERNLRDRLGSRPRWRALHFACHALVDPVRSSLSADLVVLSACETGRGRTVGGEGVLGLVRSFLQAGAPRVVASLWKVDDAATAALMGRFHENLAKRGLPAGRALREAQDWTRARDGWSHPRYWAAWVLWGLPG